MNEQHNKTAIDEYITKAEFSQKYSHLFSATEINYLIQNKEKNGFSRAVKKISYKKVLLHLPSLIEWIESK